MFIVMAITNAVISALLIIGLTAIIFVILGIAVIYLLDFLDYDIKAPGETDDNNGDESVANARRDEMPKHHHHD